MDDADRQGAARKSRDFHDSLWRQGDFWGLESSTYELHKYDRQLAAVGGRRYGRVLEIGCGAGFFTHRLAPSSDRLLAIDVAPSAIARAREQYPNLTGVEFRVANVMDFDTRAEGPWDLIVMSETVCYLGWLYPFYNVGWVAAELFAATRPGGRLLMSNTYSDEYRSLELQRPWLVHTYHNLFVNVGYDVESEERLRGEKDGATMDTLINVFVRTPTPSAPGPARE
jgi:SAM-dependent methyltransferase